jgi:amino acid adenylation domain-containing protein
MIHSGTSNISNYTNEGADQLLHYWKQQLASAPNRLELHTAHPRSSAGTYRTANLHFTISKICTDKIKLLSQQYDASLFMTLLSAFNTLLYRYTNQTDIVVGYLTRDNNIYEKGTSTDRNSNIIPLRTDLSGIPTFSELLQRVLVVVNDANEHKNLPIEVLEDALTSKEGSNGSSLFQVMFAFQDTDVPETENLLLSQNSQRTPSYAAEIDLVLSLKNTLGGLEGVLEYNAELFEASTIKGIAEHFQILLDGIVASPQKSISQLPILSETERHKILFEWNNTAARYPDDKCIHELFEEQVNKTPDAIAAALYSELNSSLPKTKSQLTYSQLNKRANQLAHYLRGEGIGPEVLVGIYMKRSLEMVVALLGILKAGGAYIPLDPGHPKSRVDFMLKDSQVSILLSQSQLIDKLPANETQVICLDTEWNKIANHDDANPVGSNKPENLAYVIYTSGSTGLPKGTLIVHRGVVNYLSWCIKAYDVAGGSGCPVNSSLGFDATVTSFLSPLLTGKHLLLLPEDGEIEALSNVLSSKNKFSLVKITPAHLEILGNLLPANKLEGQTNALIIGGEALSGKSLNLWRTHAPSTRLINEYGPTETVVGCCIYEVSEKTSLLENIPIGRPIANTQMYILDSHLQPVPIGVTGEIYIGGAGVARGYLNRRELTAERFIPNPFNTDSGSRLYKTGDLARFLNDGNIVFLGRSDHQVKIRGYRIELGEIESALLQHPEVQQTAVITREDSPGDKHLVAYLVLNKGHTVSTKKLKGFLGEKLPEYMVPSHLVILDEIPLTTNGKVDRAALPVPDQQRPDLEEAFVGARNPLEVKLTKLFEQAVGIHPIGIQDNIFELGMNSLRANRLFAQIKRITGIQLPLSILFQTPTIEQLSTYLQKKEANAPWSSLVPIQPNGSKLPMFCVHAGAGTVLFYRELSHHLGADQPVYGLQPKGLDGKQKFQKSIEEMAEHYINEIRTINPEGPYLLGGYCFGGVVVFEMAQQLISKGFKVALFANFNAVSPTYVDHSHNIATSGENEELPQSETNSKRFYRSSWRKLTQQSIKKIKRKAIQIYQWKHQVLLLKYKVIYGYLRLLALVYEYYESLGLKPFEALRKYYFLTTNTDMVAAYKPKPYPGRMTIFRSQGLYPDPHLGWSDYVTGEIKTFDIPGEHTDRRQIMNEPFVEITAKKLKMHIDELNAEAISPLSPGGGT